MGAPPKRVVSSLMDRLCERPGCSEPASVAYGMTPQDLVFWLDVMPADYSDEGGVLCQRHANSMVVPRGWTLNDLRDPDLHLFRPPDPSERRSVRPPKARPATVVVNEQLALGVDAVAVVGDEHASRFPTPGEEEPDSADDVLLERRSAVEETAAIVDDSWTPSFDEADDLDGLLAARSPLLSRAFRGAGRSQQD